MNPIELLGKIIEVSHSNLEVSARINSILNMIAQRLRFEEVIVYTLDKDKRLTCRYANEESTLFSILNRYRCHIGEGIMGGVAQKRGPQFFSLKDIPPRFGCLFYPELDGMVEKLKTFSFLPLSDDSHLYGVLLLSSASRQSVHDDEKVLLSILSREIGGILRAYDLILSSKKTISELATLSELGKVLTTNTEPHELLGDIVLIVAKALSVSFVTIHLEYSFLRLDTQRFTYGAIDPLMENHVQELERKSGETKKVVSLSDRTPGADESYFTFFLYSAPILSKDRTLGTITMCGEKMQQEFSLEEDGRYLISTIANYISSGLENTLLNRRLKDAVKELSGAQKRLIEQEKFRSLGEMTANIAHEIKNPLVIIGGFTKRLAKKAYADKTENRYIEIILKEVARLESILNEILNYVKESPVQIETCLLNDCIDEILYLFASDAAWSQVDIIREYDRDLPPIICDGQLIRQVFINILMNAYEAMEGSGRITIKTEQIAFDKERFLAVSITDTGGGIDLSIMDNIFNPFFTTKEKGTGLGLAISNKIIKNHNGRIGVKNAVGEGVTFVVYLPLRNTITKEEPL
jgi:signal transduction histidine kinase